MLWKRFNDPSQLFRLHSDKGQGGRGAGENVSSFTPLLSNSLMAQVNFSDCAMTRGRGAGEQRGKKASKRDLFLPCSPAPLLLIFFFFLLPCFPAPLLPFLFIKAVEADEVDEAKIVNEARYDLQESSALAHFGASVYLKRFKQYSIAKEQLESALEYKPNSAFLRVQLASLNLLMNDIKRAEEECRKAIKLDPNNSEAHFILGQTALKRAKNDLAISSFKKATELNANHFEAQYYLASLSIQNEDYDEAIKSYKKLTQLRPFNPNFYYNLALAYKGKNQIDDAIRELENSLKINRDYILALYQISILYSQQGKLQAAIERAKEALRIEPNNNNNKELQSLLGSLYLMAEMPDEAIDTYKSILSRDVDSEEANYRIALAYDKKGDFQKAIEHLRKTLTLNPNHSEALNTLAYLFAERDLNLQEALELINKALEIESDNGAYIDSLGWICYKLGQIDEAVKYLEKANQQLPDNSVMVDHLGDAYLKKGWSHKAISQWKRALELDPKNLKLLEKLKNYTP